MYISGKEVVLGDSLSVQDHADDVCYFVTPNLDYSEPAQIEVYFDNTADYDLAYTTDGTIPTVASDIYAGPFWIYGSCTVKCLPIERNTGWTAPLVSREFTIDIEVSAGVDSGLYTTSVEPDLTCHADYDIRYTTDGTDPGPDSPLVFDGFRVWVPGQTEIRAMAYHSTGVAGSADVYSFAYEISLAAAFSFEGGAFFDRVQVQVFCDPFYDLAYTTDGTEPSVESQPVVDYVAITTTCILRVIAIHDGVVCSGIFTLECTRYVHVWGFAQAVWRSTRVDEQVDVSMVVGWDQGVSRDVSHAVPWSESTIVDSGQHVDWGAIISIDSPKHTPWSNTGKADADSLIPWSEIRGADRQYDTPWQKILAAEQNMGLPWAMVAQHGIDCTLTWGHTQKLDFALNLTWGKPSAADSQYGIPWTKLKPLDLTVFSAHQEGAGTQTRQRISIYTDLPWISAARIIMTKQNVTFKRVADDEPVRILSGSFGIDENSLDYQFNAVIASWDDLAKVRPDALGRGTGEVEVELSINGYVGRFLVNSFTENRHWAKGTYTISGRSPSCVLGPGYCVPETAVFLSTTAEQIVASTLDGTGWGYSWGLVTNTWVIDGEFSVADKTKIEIISEIAKAVGGIVQADPYEKTLHLKKRHAVSPKNYDTAQVDEYILSGILMENAQWQTAMKYNQVVVRGKETGYFLTVRRENTEGDIPASDIIDPLLTAQALNIERGRAYLDANGYDYQSYTLELPLPASGSGQRPKMMYPCELIEVDDGSELWRGRVTSAEIGFETAKTRQRIGVERYYV